MTTPAIAEIEEETLPDLGVEAARKFTSKVVRDYVRNFLIEPAIKRQFAIGMGQVTFKQAFVVKKGADIGVEVIETEAPAAAQVKALHDIIALGVPPRVLADDAPPKMLGVIVLGETNMIEARRRAASDRMLAAGSAQASSEYVPPDGYEIVVVEDDLSGTKPPASPDDPPVVQPVMSKAQQLAAARRAKAKK